MKYCGTFKKLLELKPDFSKIFAEIKQNESKAQKKKPYYWY